MDRQQASLALAVAQGLVLEVPGAEAMATDAFDSVEDAATAYAYLVGFLVQEEALRSGRPVEEVFADLRRRLVE